MEDEPDSVPETCGSASLWNETTGKCEVDCDAAESLASDDECLATSVRLACDEGVSAVVSVSFTASGDVSDYDDETVAAIQSMVAEEAGHVPLVRCKRGDGEGSC